MEENITKCRKCLQPKVRRMVGKFASNNKKYEDDNGKTWRGLMCPQCHKEDIKSRMQAMRVLRKSLKSEE